MPIAHVSIHYRQISSNFPLVGGFNPLKNISQWEGLSHIWNKCSKPPTSPYLLLFFFSSNHWLQLAPARVPASSSSSVCTMDLAEKMVRTVRIAFPMANFTGFVGKILTGNHLVGGWATPLKNMKVSWDYLFFPTEWKKCSKPPTSHGVYHILPLPTKVSCNFSRKPNPMTISMPCWYYHQPIQNMG